MHCYPFIHSVFIGVSDRQEEHGNIRRLKETSRINEDIKNYKDWMKKAGTFGSSCCYAYRTILCNVPSSTYRTTVGIEFILDMYIGTASFRLCFNAMYLLQLS